MSNLKYPDQWLSNGILCTCRQSVSFFCWFGKNCCLPLEGVKGYRGNILVSLLHAACVYSMTNSASLSLKISLQCCWIHWSCLDFTCRTSQDEIRWIHKKIRKNKNCQNQRKSGTDKSTVNWCYKCYWRSCFVSWCTLWGQPGLASSIVGKDSPWSTNSSLPYDRLHWS